MNTNQNANNNNQQQQQQNQNANQNQQNQNANQNANQQTQQNQQQQNQQPQSQNQPKMFTQEQVNAMMSNEKKQGRNSVLKELGLNEDGIQNLKALLGIKNNQQQQNTQQNEQIAEMEKRLAVSEAKAECMTLGVKSENVDDVVSLALAKQQTSDSDLKTIVNDLKTKYPMFFNGADASTQTAQNMAQNANQGTAGGSNANGAGNTNNSGTGGTGSTPNQNTNGSQSQVGLGERLAKLQASTKPKKSLWG